MHGPVIEHLLSLSVTALKRIGLLAPRTRTTGQLNWTRANGSRIGSIGVEADTTNEIATVRLVYDHDGQRHDDTVLLRWKQSNLNNGGFYYFICPVTGRSCRKLYLVGGRFVSRFAFRASYSSQTVGPATRNGLYNQLLQFSKYEEFAAQPYRKETYNGKLTPYGRKLQRYDRRTGVLAGLLAQEANDGPNNAI